MQKSVLNKWGKFGVKILWRYTDMAIFVLRCFILTHPVHAPVTLAICQDDDITPQVFRFCLDMSGRRITPYECAHAA